MTAVRRTGLMVHHSQARWQAVAVVFLRAGFWFPDRNIMPRFRIWRWWP